MDNEKIVKISKELSSSDLYDDFDENITKIARSFDYIAEYVSNIKDVKQRLPRNDTKDEIEDSILDLQQDLNQCMVDLESLEDLVEEIK